MTPGIYFNLPDKEYRAIKAYSYSQVKRMLPTAKDYKWSVENPTQPSDDMNIGTLINRMVLEPLRDPLEGFAVKPEPRAPKGWAEQQESAGLTVISEANLKNATLAAQSLIEDSIAGPMLSGEGNSEVTLVGELFHCPVKARIDRVPVGVDYLIDLKKTRDNTPGRWEDGKSEPYWLQSPFAKQARELFYNMQAGVYLALWNQIVTDDPRYRWMNVTVESTGPYHVRVFEMEKPSIKIGLELFGQLLTKLVECEKTGVWPGYKPEVEVIGITKY